MLDRLLVLDSCTVSDAPGPAHLEQVLDLAEMTTAREAAMADAVRMGQPQGTPHLALVTRRRAVHGI